MSTAPAPAPRRDSGRLFVTLGLGLVALGLAVYAGQLALHRLTTPWYVPILATLGVVALAWSVWQRRSVWRVLAFVLAVLVAGAEWAFILGTGLPGYSGPVAAGRAFPAFTTKTADGTTFTQRDLQGGKDNVLVFFRGRW